MGLRQMDQVPFAAPSPAGWPDIADGWMSPEAMMTRIDWAIDGGADDWTAMQTPAQVAKATIQPVAADRPPCSISTTRPSPAEASGPADRQPRISAQVDRPMSLNRISLDSLILPRRAFLGGVGALQR